MTVTVQFDMPVDVVGEMTQAIVVVSGTIERIEKPAKHLRDNIFAAVEECLHGWRLTDHQTMSMAGYGAKVRSMDWLRLPMIFATSGGDCVIAWSFTGGGPMGKPPLEVGSGLGRLVTCVAVHPKSPIVAAGFDEGQVIICALSREERVVRLRWPDWERITALAWSHDGTRLAVGTDAGGVALCEVSKGLSA
jgi:Anaphase-promoting complex subunit 4 WD40 domain